MVRKNLFFTFIFVFAFLFALLQPASADVSVNAYFFWGEGCPHCAAEKKFLFDLTQKYPGFNLIDFEVYRHSENFSLLQKIGKELKIDSGGVPLLIIGDQPFVGYPPGLIDDRIESRVKKCLSSSCPDSVAPLLSKGSSFSLPSSSSSSPQNSFNQALKLPFIGLIDLDSLSLPVLTIVLGVLDGFNPCAMWVLLFLISLLLGLEDRKKMWLLGTIFIVASAAVYFLFMAAWLNLIIFLGFVIWIRIIIGCLALSAGGYSLREFWVNKNASCHVVGDKKRQRIFGKIREIISRHNLFWAALGMVGLAFMVNLIELVCSAGLPAIYSQILALNSLSIWQSYLFILLYILFFMLDDLFVFFTAMVTLHLTGLTTKYSRYARLVGGLLMTIIGLLLLFRPQWLMFG